VRLRYIQNLTWCRRSSNVESSPERLMEWQEEPFRGPLGVGPWSSLSTCTQQNVLALYTLGSYTENRALSLNGLQPCALALVWKSHHSRSSWRWQMNKGMEGR